MLSRVRNVTWRKNNDHDVKDGASSGEQPTLTLILSAASRRSDNSVVVPSSKAMRSDLTCKLVAGSCRNN